MRFPQFSIVDSKLLKSKATAEDAWAANFMKDNVAGTGPYYVDKRVPGQETVLKAVPGYWGPKPAFEQVILRVVKDPADIVALMRRGEVDLTTALGTRELSSLEQAGYSVLNAPVPNIVRIDFALEKPPLNNKLVRQALADSIPYDAILKNVFGGRGARALSYVNPQSPGYSDSFKSFTTNPQKAKDLLQQAGVSSGFDVDLFYDSGVPFFEDIALLVQDALRQYNVSAKLNAVPTTKFGQDRTARLKGEPAMQGIWLSAGVIWLDDPDPSTESTIKTKGASNYTGYSNSEIDDLHARFRFSSDTQGRQRAYEKIQQIVADDVPVLPLVVTGRNTVVNPKISGVSFTADPHTRFWTLKLKR
jgi:peptide/nickel transport system substrate-binding protein